MAYEKVSLRLAPSFVEPTTIKNLTENQQAELLTAIRERRLLIVAHHLALKQAKQAAKEEKLKAKIDRVLNRVEKNVLKIDALLETIEADLNGARQLRMEAETE